MHGHLHPIRCIFATIKKKQMSDPGPCSVNKAYKICANEIQQEPQLVKLSLGGGINQPVQTCSNLRQSNPLNPLNFLEIQKYQPQTQVEQLNRLISDTSSRGDSHTAIGAKTLERSRLAGVRGARWLQGKPRCFANARNSSKLAKASLFNVGIGKIAEPC